MKQDNRRCHSGFLSGIKYHFLEKFNSHLTLDLNESCRYPFFPLNTTFNTKRKIAKIGFFSTIFVLNSFNVANAAISSTTSHTIQGTKPQFFANETTINKLGFNYKGNDYSELKGNITSDKTKYFDENTKLSDFVIKSFFTPRTSKDDLNGDYFDFDGDAFDPTTPITSTLIPIWKDSDGHIISENDYDNAICNPKYTMPLQLEITARDIKVKTTYGDPNESDPVSSITISSQEKPITKTYKIMIAKACFAKPNATILDPNTQWRSVDETGIDDQWNLTGAGFNGIEKDKPNPEVGGGHTDDYVINQGFKVKPTVSRKHFPTTGFLGAQFQLVMSGKQEDYTFTTNNSLVEVDADGIVTLKGPVKDVTITATLKSDHNFHDNYNFTLDLWVEPQPGYVADQEQASLKCTSPMKLLERKDLNSASSFARDNLDSYQGRVYNVFTRGIGLGVFGEWGRTLKAEHYGLSPTYPKSNWDYAWYFTSESHQTTDINQKPTTEEGIVVSNHDGMISFPSAWGRYEIKRAVCGKKIY
ncbi:MULTISPECIES: hypothetical protein [unclassified Gilliamella]|uniref:hypothetical protein n=1 Tax=unclassified Gilliamella TaxID=2685620 RepID=UPI00130C4AA5|nr:MULTISPECIES: hypothetical protein [unclassified Gilliamella]MWP49919.1 hypothetical protein [Gilliamella sp. Lep-s35]MWP69560.1 hypothetical protein [Gilliamella sp. Lep-s5]MWP77866.1 hypothetical protein [Gilliamella sp. Lep-s21]